MPMGNMHAQVRLIQAAWRRSKPFRMLLCLAGLYFLLRLGLQVSMLLDPASEEVAADLQTYLSAARGLLAHAPLYPQGSIVNINFYQYAPSFALFFVPFTWLSPLAVRAVHTLLHLGAYCLLYFTWAGIFEGLGLTKANEMLAETLPVWLVFSAFWGDISYLNIYILVALLASLLIRSVLAERLGESLLWLSILLQIKPQWAFAAVLPALVGNRRFFLKLAGWSAAVYVGVLGLTLLVSGPTYAWGQYREYLNLLTRMSASFPWRGPESGFIGYNHSLKQIAAFLFGVTPAVLRAADLIKLLLLLPLGVTCLRFLKAGKTAQFSPRIRLELVFALYLGTFLWLDIFWELSLSIVIYTYLQATLLGRSSRVWIHALFLPYALLDVWQAASYAVFGSGVLIQGAYVATDPSIYLPVMMLILLAFLAILIRRLWAALPAAASQPAQFPLKGELP